MNSGRTWRGALNTSSQTSPSDKAEGGARRWFVALAILAAIGVVAVVILVMQVSGALVERSRWEIRLAEIKEQIEERGKELRNIETQLEPLQENHRQLQIKVDKLASERDSAQKAKNETDEAVYLKKSVLTTLELSIDGLRQKQEFLNKDITEKDEKLSSIQNETATKLEERDRANSVARAAQMRAAQETSNAEKAAHNAELTKAAAIHAQLRLDRLRGEAGELEGRKKTLVNLVEQFKAEITSLADIEKRIPAVKAELKRIESESAEAVAKRDAAEQQRQNLIKENAKLQLVKKNFEGIEPSLADSPRLRIRSLATPPAGLE